jgi:hypothetical protein
MLILIYIINPNQLIDLKKILINYTKMNTISDINEEILLLENKILQLKEEKCKVGLLEILGCSFHTVNNLKVQLHYKTSSSEQDQYAYRIQGELVITYENKGKKIQIDINYEEEQTHYNRYEPYITDTIKVTNENSGGGILKKLYEKYKDGGEWEGKELMEQLNAY